MTRRELGDRGVRALQAAALVAGSLVVLALALEIGLRFTWAGYYPKFDPDRPMAEWDFHPTRGWTPGPNVEKHDYSQEFQVLQKHNSLGFRGPEFALEKPPRRTRIFAVGDSQTYGIGVENDETFSAVLESLDPSLQVINGGVGAYGTDQELLLLQEWIGRLAPDLVVLAYFWNDLPDIVDGKYTQAELHEGRVRFVPPDPPTIDHPTFAHHLEKHEKLRRRYGWLRLESRLYRLLSDRLKVLDHATRAWRGIDDTRHAPFHLTPEQVAAATELTYALLHEMVELSRRYGAPFVLLVIPDQVQVEPDAVVYGVHDWMLDAQDRVRRFAEREGIPFIDPQAELRDIYVRDGEPLYFRRDRHLTPRGHRHLAELLHAELLRLGLIRGAEAPSP
jgi:lysophospholipase L1-like esterase